MFLLSYRLLILVICLQSYGVTSPFYMAKVRKKMKYPSFSTVFFTKVHKRFACHTHTFRWENRPLCVRHQAIPPLHAGLRPCVLRRPSTWYWHTATGPTKPLPTTVASAVPTSRRYSSRKLASYRRSTGRSKNLQNRALGLNFLEKVGFVFAFYDSFCIRLRRFFYFCRMISNELHGKFILPIPRMLIISAFFLLSLNFSILFDLSC